MCCTKKQKRNAGMTLLELMVAVALLAVVFLAIIRLCGTATMTAMNSRKMTALVYAAELNMEQLIGLSRNELLEKGIGSAGYGTGVSPTLTYADGVATIGGAAPSITDSAVNYWKYLDDGNTPRDNGTKSRYIVYFKKEELSAEYAAGTPEREAYKNLVRITVTAQEIPRATDPSGNPTERVMSYTLTNVLHMASEVVGGGGGTEP